MKKLLPITDEDQQTWKNLQAGDIHAMETLYKKYIQEFFRFGMSICQEEVLVQDCIQEMFLDLWNYRETLSLPVNCKFYLLRTLGNKIKRAKKNQQLFSLDETLEQGSSELMDISELDLFLEEENITQKSRQLEKAFEHLSSRQRKLIHLLFFENYSYAEASRIMDINLKSTYTLAWKALKKLRKVILIISFLVIDAIVF